MRAQSVRTWAGWLLILATCLMAGAAAPDDAARLEADIEMLAWLTDQQDWEGAFDEAARLLGTVQDPRLHYHRGVAAFRLTRYEEALESFSALSANDPEFPQLPGYRGMCLYELARSCEERGDDENARRLYSEASSALRAAAKGGRPAPALLRARAICAERAGLAEEELEALHALLAAHVDSHDARLRLALLYKDAGRLDESRGLLEAAETLDSDLRRALYNVGVQYFRGGRHEDVVAVTTRLIEEDERDAHSLRLRGLARLASGQLDGGRSDLERYLTLVPDGPDAANVRQHLEQAARE